MAFWLGNVVQSVWLLRVLDSEVFGFVDSWCWLGGNCTGEKRC